VAFAARIDESITSSQFPLMCRWNETNRPLPVRNVRMPARGRRAHPLELPADVHTGPHDTAFDFCGHVQRLSADIVRRCEILRHIDVSRLLFGITQARTGLGHGLQARVTPLRFRDGQLIRRRRGVTYQVQRYFVDSREMLYLVTFCLPRFLDQDFDDKFITVFHELYHISPDFNGDLRRHGGRYAIHTRSKCGYDRHMNQLAREYVAGGADRRLHDFLRLNFAQLRHRHGEVLGVMVPRPKVVPLGQPLLQASR
jgi:predicted metallopeptidase